MSQVVFVVNPASAGGSTRRRWPEIAHRAAAAGLAGEARMTERPGHAADLAARAAADGARLLVVVGGDGTVSEVVSGLLRGDGGAELPDVAVLPRGTGIDLGRTFGIPTDLDGAIAVARDGRPRTLDAGRVGYVGWDGTPAEAFFANAASAGMSGAVARRGNASSKHLGGRISYLWATLAVFARWQNTDVVAEVDGERREGVMLDVVVANARYLGGGMKVCPDAEPDDGLFDVLLIGDITKWDLATTLPKVYRGTHLSHAKTEVLRGGVVTVDAPTPLPVELDGEQPGTTPARFEVVPAAWRLRVPA